jgi:hypothetical protein
MSSYLSQPYEATAPQRSVNTQLVGTVLTTLKGEYDANKAKIDQTLAIYNNQLKGLRDSDNEYIVSRIKDAENIMSQYKQKNGNLAYTSTTDTLLSALKSVTEDPIIQAAVTNRAKYDQYNKNVEELKKKDPKLYNNANYQYGLYKAGFQDYMKGESKDLGSLTYTPYKDLTESHLKSLQVIKDLKGKRFVEWVDPSNPQVKRRKEIEGLTQNEIQDYFGSLLTSEDAQQLTINGWSKYGQNETEARKIYSQYTDGYINEYKSQLKIAEADSNSSAKTKKEQEEARRNSDILKEKIQSLESNKENIDNISIDKISYDLEKSAYLSGLSNIASTEWSYSEKANDVYFESKKLDIELEKLELDRRDADRKDLEFTAKMAKEYGLGPNGLPITDGQTSVSTADTELTKEVDGIKNLQTYHNEQVKEVKSAAAEILQKLPESERDAFVSRLEQRGIDTNTMELKDKNSQYSSTNTIYEAFKEAGLNKYSEYATRMKQAVTEKQKSAIDIVKVERDSYKKTFNEDQDKYVDTFLRMSKDVSIKAQQEEDLISTGNPPVELSIKLNSFIKNAGGEANLKNYLNKNPLKIREFADLMDEADKTSKGLGSFSAKAWVVPVDTKYGITYFDTNLKEDAKETVEATLRDRSARRTLNTFTAYNTVNLLSENTRKSIINKFDQGQMEGEGTFDGTKPMTVRKVGEELVFEQFQGVKGEGDKAVKTYARIRVGRGDAAYQQALTLIDLEQNKNVITIDDFEKEKPFKPKTDLDDSESDNKSIRSSVVNALSKNENKIEAMFPIVQGNPQLLSTAVDIKDTFETILAGKVGKNNAKTFSSVVADNIGRFSLQPYKAVDSDLKEAFHYDILLDGKKIDSLNLNVTTLGYNSYYLMENYPQMFISNFILENTYNQSADKTQEKINKWGNLISE